VPLGKKAGGVPRLKHGAGARGAAARARVLGLFFQATAWPAGLFLRLWTGFVDFSSRVSVEGEGARYRGPALYVNWHRYLPYLGVHHGKPRRWLMVSKDAYMAPIVRWNELHGVRVIRGGSGGGGQQAAQAMVEHLQAGDSAFLAVDGPRGPPLKVKRGCVDVARAARVPLIPVGYQCRRGRFHARRWDHWLMPRPFDTICLLYGRPLFFEPEEPLTEALERVAKGLKEVSNSEEQPGAAPPDGESRR
jgi:lysophospholipid acyltransferase (LPLAT)-like uncharacterized protein